MSIRVVVDSSRRFVRMQYEEREEPTPQDLLATAIAASADPTLASDAGLLIDRRVIPTAPTAERIRTIITRLARHAEMIRNRRIAVVYSGQATYGVLRMAQMLGESLPATLEMFETPAEAEAWLLETPTAEGR